ncbi:MAG TPA: hypothetical protein VIG56_08355, partial [Pseudolabrys sp.]
MFRLAPNIDRESEHEISEPKILRSGRGDTLVCGRSGFFGQETGGNALQLLTLPVPRERHGYQFPFDTW